MSGAVRSVVAGAFGLAVLETLLSTSGADRLAGVFNFPAAVAAWLIDPAIPGIPDRGAVASSSWAGSMGPASPAGAAPARFTLAPTAAPPGRAGVTIPPPGRPSAVPVPQSA